MSDDGVKQKTQALSDITVLFVDDERINLIIGESVLKHLEYKSLTASNGLEAISVFKHHSHEIDLIIMDINMPVLDGIEAIRHIREIDQDVKIMVTSGMLSKAQTRDLEDLGIHDILIKPYRANTVEDAIKSVIYS